MARSKGKRRSSNIKSINFGDIDKNKDGVISKKEWNLYKRSLTKRGTRKPISQSTRAGITFPVGRIGRYMRTRGAYRVSADAPIYMAAVMEFLCSEVVDIAAEVCRQSKRGRIVPRHIELGVRNDAALERFFQNQSFAGSGVTPHIDSRIVKKK